MQARENTFGLAFGFGIGCGLMELARLFERIESFQQDFVDLRRRHAGFPLTLSGLIVGVLWTVFECIRVQVHNILGLRFSFGSEPPPRNPSHNRGIDPIQARECVAVLSGPEFSR